MSDEHSPNIQENSIKYYKNTENKIFATETELPQETIQLWSLELVQDPSEIQKIQESQKVTTVKDSYQEADDDVRNYAKNVAKNVQDFVSFDLKSEALNILTKQNDLDVSFKMNLQTFNDITGFLTSNSSYLLLKNLNGVNYALSKSQAQKLIDKYLTQKNTNFQKNYSIDQKVLQESQEKIKALLRATLASAQTKSERIGNSEKGLIKELKDAIKTHKSEHDKATPELQRLKAGIIEMQKNLNNPNKTEYEKIIAIYNQVKSLIETKLTDQGTVNSELSQKIQNLSLELGALEEVQIDPENKIIIESARVPGLAVVAQAESQLEKAKVDIASLVQELELEYQKIEEYSSKISRSLEEKANQKANELIQEIRNIIDSLVDPETSVNEGRRLTEVSTHRKKSLESRQAGLVLATQGANRSKDAQEGKNLAIVLLPLITEFESLKKEFNTYFSQAKAATEIAKNNLESYKQKYEKLEASNLKNSNNEFEVQDGDSRKLNQKATGESLNNLQKIRQEAAQKIQEAKQKYTTKNQLNEGNIEKLKSYENLTTNWTTIISEARLAYEYANYFSDIGEPGEVGFGVGVAPSHIAESFGLSGMPGYQEKVNENYGNYQDSAGNIFVWIPKFYFKRDLNAQKVYISPVPKSGYVIHRAFMNNNKKIPGFFIAKFPISGTKDNMQSKPNQNYLVNVKGYEFASKARQMGGEKKYCLINVFMFNALGILALSLGQDPRIQNCAWADKEPRVPRMHNTGSHTRVSGRDFRDRSVTFNVGEGTNSLKSSGYLSSDNIEKTTHNGQKCGVSQLSGGVSEFAEGLLEAKGGWYIAKDSEDMNKIAWTDGSLQDEHKYEKFQPPSLHGTPSEFEFSTDVNSETYKLMCSGRPRSVDGRHVISWLVGLGSYDSNHNYGFQYAVGEVSLWNGATSQANPEMPVVGGSIEIDRDDCGIFCINESSRNSSYREHSSRLAALPA